MIYSFKLRNIHMENLNDSLNNLLEDLENSKISTD